MAEQIPIDPAARADDADDRERAHEILPDLAYQRLLLVNVMFIGSRGAGDGGWVLVDAGIHGSADSIVAAAEERFGKGSRPSAIVLTHAHFDHVGALESLARRWDVPVWAHELEAPYLTGAASYPPPDPTVGGGLMAWSSKLYPRGPWNVSDRLRALPADGSVPPLPGWRWLHTPGHVSFWRKDDGALIAGDAFITTAQESAYAVITQKPELHGPPMYYTQDFDKARDSVERLARLEPEMAITGHGRPMRGQPLREALHELARRFDEVAVPEQGRYVSDPANLEGGGAYRAP